MRTLLFVFAMALTLPAFASDGERDCEGALKPAKRIDWLQSRALKPGEYDARVAAYEALGRETEWVVTGRVGEDTSPNTRAFRIRLLKSGALSITGSGAGRDEHVISSRTLSLADREGLESISLVSIGPWQDDLARSLGVAYTYHDRVEVFHLSIAERLAHVAMIGRLQSDDQTDFVLRDVTLRASGNEFHFIQHRRHHRDHLGISRAMYRESRKEGLGVWGALITGLQFMLHAAWAPAGRGEWTTTYQTVLVEPSMGKVLEVQTVSEEDFKALVHFPVSYFR